MCGVSPACVSVGVIVNRSDITGLWFLCGAQKQRPGKRVFLPGEQFISHVFSGTFSSEGVDILVSGLNPEWSPLQSCGWEAPTWELGGRVSSLGGFSREWGAGPAFCTETRLSPQS